MTPRAVREPSVVWPEGEPITLDGRELASVPCSGREIVFVEHDTDRGRVLQLVIVALDSKNRRRRIVGYLFSRRSQWPALLEAFTKATRDIVERKEGQ